MDLGYGSGRWQQAVGQTGKGKSGGRPRKRNVLSKGRREERMKESKKGGKRHLQKAARRRHVMDVREGRGRKEKKTAKKKGKRQRNITLMA